MPSRLHKKVALAEVMVQSCSNLLAPDCRLSYAEPANQCCDSCQAQNNEFKSLATCSTPFSIAPAALLRLIIILYLVLSLHVSKGTHSFVVVPHVT